MKKFVYVVMLLALVMALAPTVSAQDDDSMMGLEGFLANFGPTPLAEGAGLVDVTGWTHVEPADGTIHINLTPNGAALPDGSVLEGWVVDAGLDGGPGTTNASDDDEAFGVPFGDADFDAAVEAAPYALSTGVLVELEDGTWDVQFAIPSYNFSPYDAVVITLESDGNSPDGFDPRPGTPVFIAMFADGEPLGDDMAEDDMADDDMAEDDMMDDDMMDMGEATEVTLAPTPLGEAAGWADVTGTALVWIDSGTVEITLKLGDASLPDNVAVEGWVVDAGLNGGPGETSVSDADEAFGPPFGEPAFDELVESAPYALSTGTVELDAMGDLILSFHVPAYNFSPYDAVVITLESDGNSADGFDPRPGTPVLAGAIGG